MMFSLFPNFLRSAPMNLYSLSLHRENSFDILNYLGESQHLQFLDSQPETPMYSRYYSKFIKRCDDSLIKLENLSEIMQKFKITLKKTKGDVSEFLKELHDFIKSKNLPEKSYLDEVESEIDENHVKLQIQIKTFEDLTEKRNLLHEHKISMIHAKSFIRESLVLREAEMELSHNFGEIGGDELKIDYKMGLILKEDMIRFKRLIFRASKGNAIVYLEELKREENPMDSKTMKQKEMGFFLIVFRGNAFREKLVKIIESFGTRYFKFPTESEEYSDLLEQIEQKYSELTDMLKMTETQIHSILDYFSNYQTIHKISCSLFEQHRLFLTKEKYIYTLLNYFKQADGDIIRVKCWCADSNESIVRDSLSYIAKKESHQTVGELIMTVNEDNQPPPSHFKLNDFLQPFQEIVNTYGIPRYREINPGLFTIISFPFLFGVMFGDIGHGMLLLSFGLFLCFYNINKNLSEIKWLLVLMGFFSIYCGFIYNEVFSIHLNLFKSCYQKSDKIISRAEDCIYPFGLDPIWGIAGNELTFENSFKMKLAVILGVAQMTLGIFLKGFNNWNDKNYTDFSFEFIPQIFFMCATFVYLDVMIIIKWAIDWNHDSVSPPSLISQFLNLGLKMGGIEGDSLYSTGKNQEYIQRILFVIALLTVPCMLVIKPAVIYAFRKSKPTPIYVERYSGLDIEKKGEDEKPEDVVNFNRKILSDPSEGKTEENQEKKYDEIFDNNNKDQVKGDEEIEIEDQKNDGDEEELKAFLDRPTEKEFKQLLHTMRDHVEDSEDGKEEAMSEIIVHQIIETIEFVLGSISNTASYLRLWALSLAHSQLSKVFFDKLVKGMLETNSVIGIIIGYFVFANITFAVLMCMDVMECFLHALRLHWVEFQNKFYKADGYKFQAFSFHDLLKNELEV